MKLNSLKINIPIQFNIIVIKKYNINIIIIYDKNFNFKIFFKKKNIRINFNLNTVEFNNIVLKEKMFLYNNKFFYLFNKINSYYFIKIKFKGKGYKIGFYKKKKIINFFFNKSHKSIILYNNIKVKKIKKYKLLILGSNLNKVKKLSYKIIKIRKLNEYTNRGLKLSRQIVIKRKGKKGSFV